MADKEPSLSFKQSMQKQTIEKKSQMKVLGPMHRDRPPAIWANNGIKRNNSEQKVQGN